MKDRRVSALILFVVAAAIATGPSLRLEAASPCSAGPLMTCCGGMDKDGEDAVPPCGCTLKPVTPSPAVVDAAAPPLVLAEAPTAEAPAPDVAFTHSEAAVPPRARAGPLFLLYSALLN